MAKPYQDVLHEGLFWATINNLPPFVDVFTSQVRIYQELCNDRCAVVCTTELNFPTNLLFSPFSFFFFLAQVDSVEDFLYDNSCRNLVNLYRKGSRLYFDKLIRFAERTFARRKPSEWIKKALFGEDIILPPDDYFLARVGCF